MTKKLSTIRNFPCTVLQCPVVLISLKSSLVSTTVSALKPVLCSTDLHHTMLLSSSSLSCSLVSSLLSPPPFYHNSVAPGMLSLLQVRQLLLLQNRQCCCILPLPKLWGVRVGMQIDGWGWMGGGGLFLLFVGCLMSHVSVSQGWICSDNCTSCYTEIELQIQLSHSILTPGQPVPVLTL